MKPHARNSVSNTAAAFTSRQVNDVSPSWLELRWLEVELY